MLKKIISLILFAALSVCAFSGCNLQFNETVMPDSYAAVITVKANKDAALMYYFNNKAHIIATARNDNGENLNTTQKTDLTSPKEQLNNFLDSCLQKKLFVDGGEISIECARTSSCTLDIENMGTQMKSLVDRFLTANSVNCTSTIKFNDSLAYLNSITSSKETTPSELVTSVNLPVDPNAPICKKCNGEGFYACTTCKGRGKLVCSVCGGTVYDPIGCSNCSGKGICPDCNGKGKITTNKPDNNEKETIDCTTCRGSGKCIQCDGIGKVKCKKCTATSDKSMYGYEICNYCEGSKIVKCRVCGGTGHVSD